MNEPISDLFDKIRRRIYLLESKLARMESTIATLSSQRQKLETHVRAIKMLCHGKMPLDQDDVDDNVQL